MRFINKKFMLFMTNVFLLAGIGSTIANYSTSVIRGEAATTFSVSISKYDNKSHNTGISSGNLSYGTSNTSIKATRTDTGNASITVNFARNAATNHNIFNNTSGEIRLNSNEVGNGHSLTYTISSGFKITGFQIKSSQNPGATINGGASFTSLDFTESFGSLTTSVVLKNVLNSTSGGANTPQLFNTSVATISYQSINELDAETFSTTFLSTTDNKAGSCNENDLSWSTLQSNYTTLTSNAKTQFKTNSINQTIIDARARYNYLISYNVALNDFVFGV